jgi:hypothetical protein
MGDDEINITDIEKIADEIKRLFYLEKNKVVAGKYNPAARFNQWKFWVDAAKKCAELDANPEQFVEAAFTFCPNKKTLLPHMIYGKGMEKWWKQYTMHSTSLRDRIFKSIKAEIQRLKNITGSWEREDYYEILLDECYDFHCVTRVYMFPTDMDISRKFGGEALEWLECKPAFLKAYKQLGFDYKGFVETLNKARAEAV